jgi:hypothetical protein
MKMILKVYGFILLLHSQYTEHCYRLEFVIQIKFFLSKILLSL